MNPLVCFPRADATAGVKISLTSFSIHFSEDEIYEQEQTVYFSPHSSFFVNTLVDIFGAGKSIYPIPNTSMIQSVMSSLRVNRLFVRGELRRITLFIVAVFNMLKAVPLLGVFCKGENRLYGRRERYMELSLRMAGHSV